MYRGVCKIKCDTGAATRKATAITFVSVLGIGCIFLLTKAALVPKEDVRHHDNNLGSVHLAHNKTRLASVNVPPGLSEGMSFEMHLEGQHVKITVPPGLRSGDVMHVHAPTPPPTTGLMVHQPTPPPTTRPMATPTFP